MAFAHRVFDMTLVKKSGDLELYRTPVTPEPKP